MHTVNLHCLTRSDSMLERFNLLVSTSRGNERNACREIWYLLNELGDKNPEVDTSPAIGLTVALTSLEPVGVVSKLRSILKDKPWEFRYILKIVPLEHMVPADLSEIGRTSRQLAEKIGTDESYRVTVRKRHNELRSKDIIEAVASNIDRRIDLDHPDKTVLVEVISGFAGISLITQDNILGIEKERRTLKR